MSWFITMQVMDFQRWIVINMYWSALTAVGRRLYRLISRWHFNQHKHPLLLMFSLITTPFLFLLLLFIQLGWHAVTTSPGFRLIANSGVCYKPSLAIWSLARQPPELATSTLEPHFQKDRARPCSQTRVTQITNIVVTQCTPNVHAGTFQVTTYPINPPNV